MTDDVDMPEGSVWRLVRMSDTLFRLLGADGVQWSEPDADGVYTPTVRVGPDGLMFRFKTDGSPTVPTDAEER